VIGPLGDGPYRVRALPPNEHTVPDEAPAPRFASLADARTYANGLAGSLRPSPGLIIEKLAPGGCWLPLVWL
jgi:hypothetical protein